MPPRQNAKQKQRQKQPRKRLKSQNASEDIEQDQDMLTKMPFELLMEIFGRLTPIDLLHISWTSKGLRSFVRSEGTKSLWEQAYGNLFYQPQLCPEDIDIGQYTNYVFGRLCQFCNVEASIFQTNGRLCQKCAKSCFVKADIDPTVGGLCQRWRGRREFQSPHILKAEYELRRQELAQAEKENRRKEYIQGRKVILEASAFLAYRLHACRSVNGNRERQALQRVYLNRAIHMDHWLAEEGYSFAAIRHMDHLPHVRKSQEITRNEWVQIRADIIECLQDVYDGMREDQLASELSDRVSRLGDFVNLDLKIERPLKIYPTDLQLASIDPIFSSIKSRNLSPNDLRSFESEIINFIGSWRKQVDDYLTSLVPSSSSSDTGVLDLATTFFTCSNCTEPISYPRALMHSCFLRRDGVKQPANAGKGHTDMLKDDNEVEENPAPVVTPREPRPRRNVTADTVWPMLVRSHRPGIFAGLAGIGFDEETSRCARNIIRVCGEDPDTISYETLQEKDFRFECTRCKDPLGSTSKTRLVMSWTIALLHEIDFHYPISAEDDSGWQLIDSKEDMKKIKAAESRSRKRCRHPKYRCNYCNQQVLTPQMRRHVSKHIPLVARSAELEHFYVDVDSPMRFPPYAVKI